jgi:ABC-type dipeptide/oligopeptide/nickel transport system ATPase component
MSGPESEAVLAVEDLHVTLESRSGVTSALVDGVSLEAKAGRILGVVGESGSGKTMTVRAVLGVTPGRTRVSGRIRFAGESFDGSTRAGKRLLGRQICSVFQDARSSLHPTISIGRQLGWALKRRGLETRRERLAAGTELLRRVGLSGSRGELESYPFEFSGGMCQRVALAIALAPEPSLLIADEPTSALDPTIQLEIADLFAEVAKERNLALILITHDIRLVAHVADDVVVMQQGRVVESGAAASVLAEPSDDYTRLLLRSTV